MLMCIVRQLLYSLFVGTSAKWLAGKTTLVDIFRDVEGPLQKLEWVSEWVEFNAPPDTIQVISEAEKSYML